MLFRWYTARFFTHTRAGNDPAIFFAKNSKFKMKFLFIFGVKLVSNCGCVESN